jgi:serine/threonine protein kinase
MRIRAWVRCGEMTKRPERHVMGFIREPNAEPIPGYRLIEPLGSGGFGEAWKCEAPGGLYKAIKFVFGNLNSLDVDGARAEQELNALNRVKEVRHPFVLSMDRIEVVGGELVIVMELADKSLHDAYEEALSAGLVGIPRDNLLRYIRDAAEALDHMNEKHGLQHLDIKPRNLFLVSDRVKVADFGLVKHLACSSASGIIGTVTPLYAPPETFTGAITDRSDQYSLAIVYEELLTGHRPFNGRNPRQLANQHMNEPPDLRALPEAERPVLARALEKDPARRFPSCLAFVRALYAARAASHPSLSGEESDSGSRPRSAIDPLEFQMEGQQAGNGAAFDEEYPGEEGLEEDAELAHLGESGQSVSRMGVTVAQPSTGALRPTVVVGIGGFGRRSLMELRCRLLDRFGGLEKIPLIRFLYIDTDPDAIKAAQRGAAEVAFGAHEIYHLSLQAVSHYRRRQLEQLVEWLPREKLYAMPRSLKTQGGRALGRLAFTDNYTRLMARLKREIQQATHPDAIYQTVAQTGLALRDNVPRVYVIGSATGGASGYLPDVGYAARRLLKQMSQAESPVVSFLFCGAPEDPATPRPEQANLYATLTELNHFSDPAIPFSAQYGTDGPRLVDESEPFDQIYLLSQQYRSPEARRDALSHMGSYLFHELTTPLGLRLDQVRLKRGLATPFRSLGTFGVWFPRGLLLRMAARSACQRLLEDWQANAEDGFTAPEQEVLDSACDRISADPELLPEALANQISELAAGHLGHQPREALTRVLLTFEEQSKQTVALDEPGAWARQALGRVRDWLGGGVALPGVNAIQQRRSALTRALEASAGQLAQDWGAKLSEVISSLMEQGGRRLALAEAAITRLIDFCDESLEQHKERVKQQAARTQQAQQALDNALESCISGAGGWSLFAGRSRRLVRTFVDQLAAFARQCLAEDISAAILQFFAALRGKLADQMRDLGFCRHRLRHVQETLALSADDAAGDIENMPDSATYARSQVSSSMSRSGAWEVPAAQLSPTPLLSTESFWESIRDSTTNRVVLPDGEPDLQHAARHFLDILTLEHWIHLDQMIGETVLNPGGGLLKLCMDNRDLIRYFAAPLLSETITCLSDHLPITDVAQAEFSAGEGLDDRIIAYHSAAAPILKRGAGVGPGVTPVSAGNGHGESKYKETRGSGARRLVGVGSLAGEPADVGRGHLPGSPAGPRAKQSPVSDETSFLLIPVSEAGKDFGEGARNLVPEMQLVNVPGQADLMFCREQSNLSAEDLERMLRFSRSAYLESSPVPQSSPHARFDIQDWTPLDP